MNLEWHPGIYFRNTKSDDDDDKKKRPNIGSERLINSLMRSLMMYWY